MQWRGVLFFSSRVNSDCINFLLNLNGFGLYCCLIILPERRSGFFKEPLNCFCYEILYRDSVITFPITLTKYKQTQNAWNIILWGGKTKHHTSCLLWYCFLHTFFFFRKRAYNLIHSIKFHLFSKPLSE